MNYLPFFIVSLIAYSAISNAEKTTTKKSVSSTTPAPSSSTSQAPSKTSTTAAPETTTASKTETTAAPSKATTSTATTSKATTATTSKATTATTSKATTATTSKATTATTSKATTATTSKATTATTLKATTATTSKATTATTSKTPPKSKTTAKPAKLSSQHLYRRNRKSESHNSHINIDFDNLIKNETVVKQYTNCFLDRGPCTTDSAKEMKEIIAKSIKHKCSECTEMQYSYGKRYLQHLESSHPEDYKLFLKKYDPDNHIQHFLEAAPSKLNIKDNSKPTEKPLS